MRKLILLLVICVLFSACNKNVPSKNEVSEKIQVIEASLYYPDEYAEGLVMEKHEIYEDSPQAALEALFNGPYTEKSVNVFGEDTRLLGFELVAGEATVDVSEGFLESVGDSLAIYSVVNTLTEFEDISFVRITVEGRENAVLGNYILSESFTRNETLMK